MWIVSALSSIGVAILLGYHRFIVVPCESSDCRPRIVWVVRDGYSISRCGVGFSYPCEHAFLYHIAVGPQLGHRYCILLFGVVRPCFGVRKCCYLTSRLLCEFGPQRTIRYRQWLVSWFCFMVSSSIIVCFSLRCPVARMGSQCHSVDAASPWPLQSQLGSNTS